MKKKDINWLENIYYIGMLASIIFILGQAYYARRSIIQSSEWEKAKMTIENIERFKEKLKDSPLSKGDIWLLGDGLWADFSTAEGWMLSDTLRKTYWSLFDNPTDTKEELMRMIETMDAFAYPIIMGYASETGSYQIAIRQYYTFSGFIMPYAFHEFPNIAIHAKLLYRLWRIRSEQMMVDLALTGHYDDIFDSFKARIDHLLYYEETDITEASLKKYSKILDKKLKEMQKEIEVFRKNSLK